MKNTSRNVSKLIFCICLPIVLCATKVKASNLPPNPDNAALLYYQAFLLRPEPNMAVTEKIHDVLFDAEPDRQIRIYLGRCLPMIQMAEIASRIPQCTWGLWNGPGSSFDWRDLDPELSSLYYALAVDARTLAVDGHYRAALDHCLTLRRLSRHLSEDSRLDLAARNPDLMALRTIQHVLSVMPPDEGTLTWFRAQLGVVQGLHLSFSEMLQAESISFLNLMKTNPYTLTSVRNLLVELANDEDVKQEARSLTNEQLLLRAHDGLPRFVDSLVMIADSEMAYEQKLAQMRRLINRVKDDDNTDPVVARIILMSGIQGLINRQYPYLVGHQAHINGIKTAVEVYLVVAKTGKLPEKLPDNVPKDPFTGRDFEYKTTDEGFALRCQGEEFVRRKNQFFTFKVRK